MPQGKMILIMIFIAVQSFSYLLSFPSGGQPAAPACRPSLRCGSISSVNRLPRPQRCKSINISDWFCSIYLQLRVKSLKIAPSSKSRSKDRKGDERRVVLEQLGLSAMFFPSWCFWGKQASHLLILAEPIMNLRWLLIKVLLLFSFYVLLQKALPSPFMTWAQIHPN